MKIEQIKEIANAVLYEGYLLYPYRQSAIKNRTRWTFGVVYPREYSEANGGTEPWTMHTECLVEGRVDDISLDVTVRFLHLLVRTVIRPEPAKDDRVEANAGEWSLTRRLADEPLQEGMEREVKAADLSLSDLLAHPRRVAIEFPTARMKEHPAHSTEIIREQQALAGALILAAEQVDTNLFKLSVEIENTTPETGMVTSRREAVLFQSFVSTHTILQVRQGSFISLLEAPEELQPFVKSCQNLRTWPVLVGNEGERNAMLSSPIILYDYPQIAPESPGALFDGSEIDEILTLRIMTLTDEEKEQMRQDERTREILERTEALTPEQFMKLHGVIRELRPISEGEKG
jgi:hydrogenase maturation protease